MARSLLLAGALLAAAARADEATVVTKLGAIQGQVLEDGTGRLFMGVPYADHVVRWRNAAPVPAWAPATLDATKEAPGCIQLCTEDEPPHICPVHQSEDCLFMNVWTPRLPPGASAPTTPWPVIVRVADGWGGVGGDGRWGGAEAAGSGKRRRGGRRAAAGPHRRIAASAARVRSPRDRSERRARAARRSRRAPAGSRRALQRHV